MKRKLLSIILAVFMVFGIIPFTSQASDSRGYTDAYETLTKEMDNKLEDGKEYEFIVEIFENNRPVSRQRRDLTAQTFSSAVRRGRELSLVEKRINDQNEVLADIFGERQIRRHSDEISYSTMSRASSFRARNNSRPIIRDTEQLKTMPRYKALLNGFALKMTYAEAKQVAMLPNVKAVTKAVEYNMPKDETPSMHNSRITVGADKSNAKGYDGKGRVVAILDTGADVSHPDFRLTDDAAAKYNEKSIKAKIDALHLMGRYETPKIPYAYNYADRSFDILDSADHGQHIAGTIAGNAKDPNEGVVGIVPEAQLLVMRVFPLGRPTTNTAFYAEAIDDAVLLEADSINMSLGSFAGSEDVDKILAKVVHNAIEHGTVVAIAGGNDGYQFDRSYQSSDILDFATVGDPSTMKESFAVASLNNKYFYDKGIFEHNSKELDTVVAEYGKAGPTEDLIPDQEYEVVFVGKGNQDEYYVDSNGKPIDAAGKIVLAERGAGNYPKEDGSFAQKAIVAKNHGAAACFIGYTVNFGQNPDFMYQPYIETTVPFVPTFGLSNNSYKAILDQLKAGNNKITFKKIEENGLLSQVTGNMSSFSSWGPTPGLGIKPEITAPGGDIWSTANNGGYQFMSGTSMATPHVAAGIAAVRGAIKDVNLGLKENEIAPFVKKVLMNTADFVYATDHKSYFSVRSQGAGLMNLDAATNKNFVTVEDAREGASSVGEAKIEYKSVQDNKLDIDVKLKNYASEAASYKVYLTLQTDTVTEDGKINLSPDTYSATTLYERQEIGEVTVDASGELVFTKNDITWNDNAIGDKYPNGYFVDGYLEFVPTDNKFSTLSVPMLAFRGAWEDMPVIEKFIHEFDLTKEQPKALKGKSEDDILDMSADSINATMFITENQYLDNNETFIQALGRAANDKFTKHFAISPGVKDKSQDWMKFKGFFLRNWEDFYIEVKDSNDELVKKISNPYRKDGPKTGDARKLLAYTEDVWVWDGTNADGEQVPEGTYKVSVNVKPRNVTGAKSQELSYDVIVDNTKPEITERPVYDGTNKTLKVKATDETSGIKAVYYLYETGDEEKPTNIIYNDTADNEGNYVLEDGNDKGIVFVEDWAGNITKLDLSQDGSNKIEIQKQAEVGVDIPNVDVVVYNSNQDVMTDLTKLADGKYTIEVRNLPADYNVEIDHKEVEFKADDTEKTKVVTIKFSKVTPKEFEKYGTLRVKVIDGNTAGQGYTVFAIDKDGNKRELNRKFDWGSEVYEVKLPAGKYTIAVLNQYGEEVPSAGKKEVEIKEQDLTFRNIRILSRSWVLAWIRTDIPEVFEDVNSLSVGYNPESNQHTFDAMKLFNIVDPDTGKNLFEGENYHEAYFKIWGNGKGIDFYIPSDGPVYNVRLKSDYDKYLVEYGMHHDDEYNEDWVTIDIKERLEQKANIEVVEERMSGIDGTIDAEYKLYDADGTEIPNTTTTTWENIEAKKYTLKVINHSNNLVPERNVYDIDAYANQNIKQTVRWTKVNKGETSMEMAFYGDYPSNLKKLKVTLKNLTAASPEKTYEIPVGVRLDEVISRGTYEVTVELPQDTIIEAVFLSSKNYEDVKEELTNIGSKFKMTLTTSYNGFEIKLRRQKRDFGEVQVKATGLGEGQAKYELVKNSEAVYTSNDGIFRDVEPGDYTLKVTAPNGYTVEPTEVAVTVTAGQVTEQDVTFTRNLEKAETVSVNVKAVEVNEKGEVLRELDGFEYEAKFKDGTDVDLTKVPAGIEVKISEKKVKDGFERVVPSEGFRKFDKDSEILIKYLSTNVIEIDPESNETKEGYVKVVFDATEHGVLYGPGFTNVQKIAYLVNEKYPIDEFGYYIPTAKGNENYEFKSWEPRVEVKDGTYVAQYEYHEPVVPTPNPTPTPEPTPEEPSVPHRPYRPNRPNRPTTPTKDIVKETTKPAETTKPVEEKKDYGIVETMPTIAATFSDLPENAAAGSIMNMVARGILKGMDNGKFEGELPITRAMVATVLKRLSKDQTINNVPNFTDVKATDWFADAVKWAQSQGLIKGYEDGTFKANNLVTRQELAIIIERFLKVHGITMDEVKELSYKDLDTLPTWSRDAIIAMAKIGLVEGQTAEMYNPTSEFTREELAVMLEKIIEWVEKH